jgi:hypothetical protein
LSGTATFAGPVYFHWSDYTFDELMHLADEGEIDLLGLSFDASGPLSLGFLGNGPASPRGGGLDKARNQARLMLSNIDCANFIKSVLTNLGNAPNLDAFLKEFDHLTIIPTPPGDAKTDPGYVGPGFTAHIASGVGQSSTVHVDGPNAADLVPTLLHETFHDTAYFRTDQELAKAATGDSRYLKATQKEASQAASKAFDEHCTPKGAK